MLARGVPGAGVFVCPDRFWAGTLAERRFGAHGAPARRWVPARQVRATSISLVVAAGRRGRPAAAVAAASASRSRRCGMADALIVSPARRRPTPPRWRRAGAWRMRSPSRRTRPCRAPSSPGAAPLRLPRDRADRRARRHRPSPRRSSPTSRRTAGRLADAPRLPRSPRLHGGATWPPSPAASATPVPGAVLTTEKDAVRLLPLRPLPFARGLRAADRRRSSRRTCSDVAARNACDGARRRRTRDTDAMASPWRYALEYRAVAAVAAAVRRPAAMGEPRRCGTGIGFDLLPARRAAPAADASPTCRPRFRTSRRRELRAIARGVFVAFRDAADRVAALQRPARVSDAGLGGVRGRRARPQAHARRQGRALHHRPLRLLGAARDGARAALPAHRRGRAGARQPATERLARAAADGSPATASSTGAAALRRILRALGDNQGVAILIDQHIQTTEAVVVDFFNRPAATTSAVAALALRTGAPIIPVFAVRLPRRALPDDLRAPGGAAAGRSSRRRPRADAALHRRPRDVRAPVSAQLVVDAPALARPAARRARSRACSRPERARNDPRSWSGRRTGWATSSWRVPALAAIRAAQPERARSRSRRRQAFADLLRGDPRRGRAWCRCAGSGIRALRAHASRRCGRRLRPRHPAHQLVRQRARGGSRAGIPSAGAIGATCAAAC